jgi:hypothetical protein
LLRAAKHRGLLLTGMADIGNSSEIEPVLKAFKKAGVVQINFQLCDHDTPLSKALSVARKIMKLATALSLKASIEGHRDTCTETPEKAYALANAFQKATSKKLRMNFDHSHPAVIKHLNPSNYWSRLGVRLDLLKHCELLHLRPFNGHHAQIPITDGKRRLSPEFKEWLPFCEELLRTWIQKRGKRGDFFIVPELGPKGPGEYNLSCFPNVLEEVQVLTREIRKIWNRICKE